MGKWTNAAKDLKERWKGREEKASDMEVLISKLAQLPPRPVEEGLV